MISSPYPIPIHILFLSFIFDVRQKKKTKNNIEKNSNFLWINSSGKTEYPTKDIQGIQINFNLTKVT